MSGNIRAVLSPVSTGAEANSSLENEGTFDGLRRAHLKRLREELHGAGLNSSVIATPSESKWIRTLDPTTIVGEMGFSGEQIRGFSVPTKKLLVDFSDHLCEQLKRKTITSSVDCTLSGEVLRVMAAETALTMERSILGLSSKLLEPEVLHEVFINNIIRFTHKYHSQRWKEEVGDALVAYIQTLLPPTYQNELNHWLFSTKSAIKETIRGFRTETFLFRPRLDPAISLNPRLFFTRNVRMFPEGKESMEGTILGWLYQQQLDEQLTMSRNRFNDFRKELRANFGASRVLLSSTDVTDENCGAFPLLVVSARSGVVENKKSQFYGMRNATTREEWLSLREFILTTMMVRSDGLSSGFDTLFSRCRDGQTALLTSSGITLHEIFRVMYAKRIGPQAVCLATWLEAAVRSETRSKSWTGSYLMLLNCIYSLLRLEYLWMPERHFAQKLSVSELRVVVPQPEETREPGTFDSMDSDFF